jgi:iron complex outermembrane receptor protein
MSPRLVPTALAVALSVAASAADSDPSIILVETQREPLTTSTASAAETELGLVPGGTDVVSGDEIRRGRTATWRDALGMSPGVYVQPRFGSDEARLSIRGSGLQRTFHMRGIRVLADGQPVTLADGGTDFQSSDFALLDHVSVWRGANALAYGGATLGGVIDLVSPTGRSSPGGSVRLEGGSFGYGKAVATVGGAEGDVDAWFGISSTRQEGYREHSAQDNVRVQGNIGWRFAEQAENRVFAAYARSDSELPGALTKAQAEADPEQAASPSVQYDSKRDFPQLRLADRIAVTWGDTTLDASLGWMHKELDHPIAVPGFNTIIVQDSDDLVAAARLQDQHGLGGRGNRVVLGVEAGQGRTDSLQYAYANASGNERGALTSDYLQEASNLAAYGEWRHEVQPGWWAIAGVQAQWTRLDAEDRLLGNGDQSGAKSWTNLNPKLGLLWQGEQTAAFANLSRSSEAPTFSEYVQFDPATFSTRPWDDLESQSAWTVEIGSRGSIDRVRWDVALYYARVQDEYLAYSAGFSQVTRNADRTVHAGAEIGGEIRLLGDAAETESRLVLGLAYTWGRFRFDDDAVYGDAQIPGLPEHAGRAELLWRFQGWYAGPTIEGQGGWPVDFANTEDVDGAILLGAKAGYDDGRGLSWFVEGRNLLDEGWIATTGVANPNSGAGVPANQALFNPGDGLAVNAGAAWRW